MHWLRSPYYPKPEQTIPFVPRFVHKNFLSLFANVCEETQHSTNRLCLESMGWYESRCHCDLYKLTAHSNIHKFCLSHNISAIHDSNNNRKIIRGLQHDARNLCVTPNFFSMSSFDFFCTPKCLLNVIPSSNSNFPL